MGDLVSSLTVLYREGMDGKPEDGEYTWFVEEQQALIPSMDELSAGQASHVLKPGVATIAAHYYHILFMLSGANAYIAGGQPSGTWESSWDKQVVTEEEWLRLRSDIKREYEQNLDSFQQIESWPDPQWITGGAALVPHLAFHLGAIRQLMKLLP